MQRSLCPSKPGILCCWSLFDISSTKSSIIFRSGTESGYTVMGLQNNTVYDVKLRSQNKFGWSPFSHVFTFQTMDKHKLSLTLQEKPSNPILDSQGPLKSEPVVSGGPGQVDIVQRVAVIVLLCVSLIRLQIWM